MIRYNLWQQYPAIYWSYHSFIGASTDHDHAALLHQITQTCSIRGSDLAHERSCMSLTVLKQAFSLPLYSITPLTFFMYAIIDRLPLKLERVGIMPDNNPKPPPPPRMIY